MTNKEVAELAGVSSAAVSRFLNGGYLSEEKRERIAAAIEQTGYVPSANARILRMKKSDTVGIILTKSDESTLTGVTAGLEKYLFAAGYGASLAYVTDEEGADFNAMRTREGEKLAEDLLQKADKIEEMVRAVECKAPNTVLAYRERLEAKLREILNDSSVTEERVIAEAAIFADRVATDEETVRLHSHLSQFRKLMAEGSPIGRKLDFLIQEFNREANTIGSKCQDSEIAYLVVELKSEIEKIREQVQNIE